MDDYKGWNVHNYGNACSYTSGNGIGNISPYYIYDTGNSCGFGEISCFLGDLLDGEGGLSCFFYEDNEKLITNYR